MLLPLLSKHTNKGVNLLFFSMLRIAVDETCGQAEKCLHMNLHTCSCVCFFRDFCPTRIMDVWVSTVLWGPRGSSSTADTVASRGRRAPTQTSDDGGGEKKTQNNATRFILLHPWTHPTHRFLGVLRMLPFCGFNLFCRFPVLNCYYCFDPQYFTILFIFIFIVIIGTLLPFGENISSSAALIAS